MLEGYKCCGGGGEVEQDKQDRELGWGLQPGIGWTSRRSYLNKPDGGLPCGYLENKQREQPEERP